MRTRVSHVTEKLSAQGDDMAARELEGSSGKSSNVHSYDSGSGRRSAALANGHVTCKETCALDVTIIHDTLGTDPVCTRIFLIASYNIF